MIEKRTFGHVGIGFRRISLLDIRKIISSYLTSTPVDPCFFLKRDEIYDSHFAVVTGKRHKFAPYRHHRNRTTGSISDGRFVFEKLTRERGTKLNSWISSQKPVCDYHRRRFIVGPPPAQKKSGPSKVPARKSPIPCCQRTGKTSFRKPKNKSVVLILNI